MAQQQAIKLKIAGKSYSFTLKHEANEEQSLAEKEELYRLAEREVNAYVTRFEKAKYEGFSTQDCLAMAALQLAISSVSLARSREVGSEDLRRLEALRDEIDEYLNRIETERNNREGYEGDRIEKSASIIVLYHTFKKNLPA